MAEAIESAKLRGADEYLESAEGKLLLEEQVERGVRAYRKAVLEDGNRLKLYSTHLLSD